MCRIDGIDCLVWLIDDRDCLMWRIDDRDCLMWRIDGLDCLMYRVDEDKSGEISDIELKDALVSMGVQVPLLIYIYIYIYIYISSETASERRGITFKKIRSFT